MTGEDDMDAEEDSGGRLSRWSKRKLAARAESEAEIPAIRDERPDTDILELEAEREANRVAAEAIDLDDLTADSDMSVFLKDGVPELLKKRALSKLWRTSPVFANIDGLVDYDDDFADPSLIMKTFESAYKVGKGYFDDLSDEEAEQGPQEQEMDGNSATDHREESDEPDEAGGEETTVAEATGNSVKSDADQDERAEAAEETQLPKVSLRQRLQLDESA